MSTKIEQLYAIGTVVRLKGGQKRLMIFGIKQNNGDEDNKLYDYIGVVYPEGNMGFESQFVFNHEDIEEVYFAGFNDIERQSFISELSKYVSENNE